MDAFYEVKYEHANKEDCRSQSVDESAKVIYTSDISVKVVAYGEAGNVILLGRCCEVLQSEAQGVGLTHEYSSMMCDFLILSLSQWKTSGKQVVRKTTE